MNTHAQTHTRTRANPRTHLKSHARQSHAHARANEFTEIGSGHRARERVHSLVPVPARTFTPHRSAAAAQQRSSACWNVPRNTTATRPAVRPASARTCATRTYRTHCRDASARAFRETIVARTHRQRVMRQQTIFILYTHTHTPICGLRHTQPAAQSRWI